MDRVVGIENFQEVQEAQNASSWLNRVQVTKT
jgi:hypothetical protein